jgi:hypothetical protein
VGFYAGRLGAYQWNWSYSWSGLCQNNSVWLSAQLGSEWNFFLELDPFALQADVLYWVNVGVGASVCGVSGSIRVAGHLGGEVYVSAAYGSLGGKFGGHVRVCGKNKCVNLVKIPDVNVNVTLWQG